MRINCAGESGIVYRILIVDDEKIERTGLRLLLGKMDQKFEITEAVNGKEALEWLSCNRADILVTDIRMPFVDGLELVEQAARLYPDMKAMVFSGYGEFEYARRAMRFGVEDFEAGKSDRISERDKKDYTCIGREQTGKEPQADRRQPV